MNAIASNELLKVVRHRLAVVRPIDAGHGTNKGQLLTQAVRAIQAEP